MQVDLSVLDSARGGVALLPTSRQTACRCERSSGRHFAVDPRGKCILFSGPRPKGSAHRAPTLPGAPSDTTTHTWGGPFHSCFGQGSARRLRFDSGCRAMSSCNAFFNGPGSSGLMSINPGPPAGGTGRWTKCPLGGVNEPRPQPRRLGQRRNERRRPGRKTAHGSISHVGRGGRARQPIYVGAAASAQITGQFALNTWHRHFFGHTSRAPTPDPPFDSLGAGRVSGPIDWQLARARTVNEQCEVYQVVAPPQPQGPPLPRSGSKRRRGGEHLGRAFFRGLYDAQAQTHRPGDRPISGGRRAISGSP